MFDTVQGLPVHVLAVHAVVVLLPLAALATVAVAVVPRLRRHAWWVAAGVAGVAVLTWVARLSGEEFQERLGGQVAIEHGDLGRTLSWFVLALLASSIAVAMLPHLQSAGPPARGAAAAFAVVAAVLVLAWVVRTGHSGSEAVWAQIVRSTDAR